MKINPTIQEIIAAKVLETSEEKEPSGRMSASRLGWPLQWQMLHYYKVRSKGLDEYTLRKFQRGKDVEERIMKWLATSDDRMQVPVEYRGVVGIMDVLLEYPIEVKSVTNAAFKYKQKEGPSRAHRLQAMLYAKAKGFDTYGVAYVASDDYRVLCFEDQVTDELDEVITRYDKQIESGIVPMFKEEENWQGDIKYNSYPEFKMLDEIGIARQLSSMGVVVPGGLKI